MTELTPFTRKVLERVREAGAIRCIDLARCRPGTAPGNARYNRHNDALRLLHRLGLVRSERYGMSTYYMATTTKEAKA